MSSLLSVDAVDWSFRPADYSTNSPYIEYPILAQAPGFGGGSYLPRLRPREVEIAGLALATVTGDCVSVRAQLVEDGIRYRVVDEYRTRYVVSDRVRPRPLSLRELVDLIDSVRGRGSSGLFEAALNFNWEASDKKGDPEKWIDFITVISPFYPMLPLIFAERASNWVSEQRSAKATRRRKRPSASQLRLPISEVPDGT